MAMKVKMPRKPEKAVPEAQHFIRLQEVLELKGSPIAVAIGPDSPQELKSLQHKATACMMVQIARSGSAFRSSGNGILCGGRANLGVGESPIQKLDEFLVHREKLFISESAARKLIDLDKKLAPDQGKYLAFAPLVNLTLYQYRVRMPIRAEVCTARRKSHEKKNDASFSR